MRFFHTDLFELPLPDGHRFPMSKYRLLRERLLQAGVATSVDLRIPVAATDLQLQLVHDADYVERVITGTLSREEIRRIGFPWSAAMVERSRRSVGATIEAARCALEMGFAANLAGGTHHAGLAFGEGFCVFNDVAVAARVLQAEDRIRRAVIIDCDLHQGNGTAEIFAHDESVFTMSIHAAKNFPLRKYASDLDVALPDGTEDRDYLLELDSALDAALDIAHADVAFYVSGADPYVGDRLGRMRLTKQGLAARDRMVLSRCLQRKLPVAISMGGGYAHDVADIVDIHCETLRIASELSNGFARRAGGGQMAE